MPCCCSLAFPHMQKQPSLSIIYTLTTHHHIHMFFFSSCPALKNKKMRPRKVLKSLCRRASSSSSSSSTKHTRCLSRGGRKKKTTPTNNTHRMQYMLVVLFPCSLFPLFPFPPVRFDSFLMHIAMIVKLWNFQKKTEGKENNKKHKKKIRWKKNKEKMSSRGQRSVGPWISSSSVCKKSIKNLLPLNIATWPNESS